MVGRAMLLILLRLVLGTIWIVVLVELVCFFPTSNPPQTFGHEARGMRSQEQTIVGPGSELPPVPVSVQKLTNENTLNALP